ncbi:MAP protein kinase [Trypanosoma grayi]|uniref:MAP protein kinase n=1 Tax=Trypanosoma grayi TaxID=71804 RepID=UPI0004F422E6|nr:MAP protein kinase [Trypanosoma grayi]KEG11656.1 MAP protein kinase [Trypanosoma grayi]
MERESDEDIADSAKKGSDGCRIKTMVVIATVMSLGVLLVGLVGFLPMHFTGFTAAWRTTKMVHSQAVTGLLATVNNSVMQLPNLINTIATNYIMAPSSNESFFPESKTKLLFALANILSKKTYRDMVGYFLVVKAEPADDTWGVLAAAFLDEEEIGGAVMHGLEPVPICRIDPETANYSVPIQTLAAYNISLNLTLSRDDGPYKTVVLPWNENRIRGIPWRKRWFTTGFNISSMYFDYVLPFVTNGNLGFWEAGMRREALNQQTVQALWRALRDNGRVMVFDPTTGIVLTNNWNQLSSTRENVSGSWIWVPLTIDIINDPLMQTMIHRVRSQGNFTEFMEGFDRKELSFTFQGGAAYARILRLTDKYGLDILLCIATLKSDFFRDVFLARTVVSVAVSVSVGIVALFAIVIAYFVVKPLQHLVPALKRASNLQLRGGCCEDDENNDAWQKSSIAEVRDIQHGYAELTRQLSIVKTFVPESILAAPSGSRERAFSRQGSETLKQMHTKPSDSTLRTVSEIEIMEQNGFAKLRQEMRLNSRVFKEQPNAFVRRYCTLVLIENAQPFSLDAYFHNILTCAAELNGCVEYLRPDRTLVSFGAHSPLPMHSIKGCRFAIELFTKLRYQEQETVTILVDSNEFLVGTCGAHSRNARVVVGVMNLYELTKVVKELGCRLVATAGTATQLQESQVFPVDCVLLSSSSVPVVLSEIRIQGSSSQNMINTAKHFRLGFAAMRQGCYKQAMAHYQRVGKSDPQAQRLVRLCAQKCLLKDATPYVRLSNDPYSINMYSPGTPLEEPSDDACPHTKQIQKDERFDMKCDTKDQNESAVENSEALFEMYQSSSSSESLQPCDDGCTGADDVPLFLPDMNQRVWTRSLNKISEGAFSAVFLGMSEDGVQVAIKCIPRRRRDIMQESLEAEMNVASKLRHPNIVQYVSCSVVKSHLAIMMEYVPGGSLHTVIKNFGRVSPLVARRFTVDILNGLNYLHSLGIVHCDVKPHNVLLGMDGVCKLSDFGSTISEATDMARTMVDEVTLRGTALYMAPEVAGGGRCTPQSDIFSLGISLLEMLLGRLPWRWSSKAPEGSDAALLHIVLKRDTLLVQSLARGHLEPEIPDSLDREAAFFVRSCCHPDPSMRPSALGLLSYAFVL